MDLRRGACMGSAGSCSAILALQEEQPEELCRMPGQPSLACTCLEPTASNRMQGQDP